MWHLKIKMITMMMMTKMKSKNLYDYIEICYVLMILLTCISREIKAPSTQKKSTDASAKDSTWARLSAVHAANKEKLEQLRLQLEKQKMAECTFSPAIIK